MKCTMLTETLEFWELKVPSSRFALHGLAPPEFTVCALFLPLIHGLCAFFMPLLTCVSTAPSWPDSEFTVCTSRFTRLVACLRKSTREWTFHVEIHCEIPSSDVSFFWVHANGGIINGVVACVCAKWRVFAHFCMFLRFLCVSVRFFVPKWPAEKRKFAHNRAKMCKKRFYAMPPFVIPPFACHRFLD